MRWLLLLVGIFACSTSAIFIKASTMHPAYLAALRLFMASLLLLPVFLQHRRKYPDLTLGQLFGNACVPGMLLGLHFISWNQGARLTLTAHATLIVNMVPVALPVLLWMTQREGLNRREVVGTLLSVAGIGVLAWHDYQFSRDYLRGDLICLISMILFAAYLAMGRKNRMIKSVFLYIVPVYVVAGVVCLLVSLFYWENVLESRMQDYGIALALALIPTLLGHSLINNAMRHLRGQVVGVMNVGQFVFAGILAYLLFREIPHPIFYWVSFFVVVSCVIVIAPFRRAR